MHEDLLRHLWSRQLFDTSGLTTTDGSPVTVRHPGTISRISGPDFRNAQIGIGGTLFAGDVEFHRSCSDWTLHGHHNDPAYNSVILHVVLHGDASPVMSHSGRSIPTVVLAPLLPVPVHSIGDHLLREEYRSRRTTIPCAHYNEGIPSAILEEWTDTLARERLGEKVRRMRGRLDDIILAQQRTIGEPELPYPHIGEEPPFPEPAPDRAEYARRAAWEQLLYEEMMDCLGYSNNREPMKMLAERTPVHRLRTMNRSVNDAGTGDDRITPSHIEALLFRISGLLPDVENVSDTTSRVYVHSLTAALQELDHRPEEPPMHPSLWNFSPTRPANFPTIRIAAGAELLFRILFHSLFRSIITVVSTRTTAPKLLIARLAALFDAGNHPFWNYHYSFDEGSFQHHAILGTARTNDILVNAVVPFVLLYASIFRDHQLEQRCLNIAEEVPLLEENSVLRILRTHLLKDRITVPTSFRQQGMLQLYKRYCTRERCSECRIGQRLMDP